MLNRIIRSVVGIGSLELFCLIMNKDWVKPASSFLRAKRHTPDSEILRMGSILSDEALLYQTLQQPNTANARYESAMHQFSQLNASLRMAETLLSWARLSGSQQHFLAGCNIVSTGWLCQWSVGCR